MSFFGSPVGAVLEGALGFALARQALRKSNESDLEQANANALRAKRLVIDPSERPLLEALVVRHENIAGFHQRESILYGAAAAGVTGLALYVLYAHAQQGWRNR